VELRDREKDCNLCHYIANLRDGSKRVTKFFSNQFRERVKMEKEREWTHTKRFEFEIFFSSLKIFVPLF
jgi:hypothetical protein